MSKTEIFKPSAADWWHIGELERSFEGVFVAFILLAPDGSPFTVSSPQLPEEVCAELARQAVGR